MKILLVNPTALPSPPKDMGYGGVERVSHLYARGLADLGNDVAIVGAKGSKAPAGVELIETVPPWSEINPAEQQRYTQEDSVERSWENLKWKAPTWNGWRAQEAAAFEFYKDRVKDFDVVGDMSWSKQSYSTSKDEIVSTIHSVSSHNKPPRDFPCFLGVSYPHARFLTTQLGIPHRVAWNPVDTDVYALEKTKGDRILSLNRIMVQKGIHMFVQLCEKLKVKGDVAGEDVSLIPDQNYVNMIKQSCAKSSVLNYLGPVSDKTKIPLLKSAMATVCFVDAGYQEVFGLMAVESMLCGTPVVAANSWGFNDIIQNGVNGFLVNNLDEACKAVDKIRLKTEMFDPVKVRESAMRFSIEKSCKHYEGILKAVESGSRW